MSWRRIKPPKAKTWEEMKEKEIEPLMCTECGIKSDPLTGEPRGQWWIIETGIYCPVCAAHRKPEPCPHCTGMMELFKRCWTCRTCGYIDGPGTFERGGSSWYIQILIKHYMTLKRKEKEAENKKAAKRAFDSLFPGSNEGGEVT